MLQNNAKLLRFVCLPARPTFFNLPPMPVAPPLPIRGPFAHRSGWFTVGIGLLLLVTINGLSTSSLSVLDEQLTASFGFTRASLKLRETITYAVSAAFILVSGVLIDRFGVRRLLMAGLALMATALAGYGLAASSGQVYAMHGLLGLAYVTAGPIPVIILVSSHFRENRGLALGITLAGTSLGSAIFPPVLTALSEAYGWRQAFLSLSLLPLLLLLPVFFWVKNQPASPDADALAAAAPADRSHSYRQALHSVFFWLVAACGLLSFLGIVGVVSNLFLFLRGQQFSPDEAAYVLSLYFVVALCGKFLLAWLSDRFSPFALLTLCLLGLAAGVAALTLAGSEPVRVLPAVGLAALSWGGVFTLYNILIVNTFGLKEAGKINGTLHLFENVGSLTGPLLAGYWFQQSGHYQGAFVAMAALLGLAAGLSVPLRRLAGRVAAPTGG